MSELNHPIIFVVLLLVMLLAAQAALRWWRENQYNFNGKTVMITGGSRGLGLVMARELVQQGARIVITF